MNDHDDAANTEQKAARTWNEAEKAIRLSGLGWWFKDAELEALCTPHGKVVKLTIDYNHPNGMSLGKAMIEFEDAASAGMAHEALKAHEFGRNVDVSLTALGEHPEGAPAQNDSRKPDTSAEHQANTQPPPLPFMNPYGMPPGQPVPRPMFPPGLGAPGLVPPAGFQAGAFPLMMPGMDPSMFVNQGPGPMQQMPQGTMDSNAGSGRRGRNWDQKGGDSKRRRDESNNGGRSRDRERDRDRDRDNNREERDRDRDRSDDRHRHRDRRDKEHKGSHRDYGESDRRERRDRGRSGHSRR